MGADTFLPRGRLLALGSSWEAAALENVTHALIADVVAQLGQGAGNAVVAPAAIFLGHVHDQVFKLFVDTGASYRLSLLGAIEFLSHQFAMPGEDGGGFDDSGDFLQRSLPQLLTDLGQGL